MGWQTGGRDHISSFNNFFYHECTKTSVCVYVHLFLVSSDLDQENIILYVTVSIRSSNLRGLYQKKNNNITLGPLIKILNYKKLYQQLYTCESERMKAILQNGEFSLTEKTIFSLLLVRIPGLAYCCCCCLVASAISDST